jgi:phage replication-related protein YjqB (UPF0714/DUF867 family)
MELFTAVENQFIIVGGVERTKKFRVARIEAAGFSLLAEE